MNLLYRFQPKSQSILIVTGEVCFGTEFQSVALIKSFAVYCSQVVGAWMWEQDGDTPFISVRPRSGCVIGGYVSDVLGWGEHASAPACSRSAVNFSCRRRLFPMGCKRANAALSGSNPAPLSAPTTQSHISLPTEPSSGHMPLRQ